MNTNPSTAEIHYLWPTPLLTAKLDQHKEVNASLLQLFEQHREKYDKKKAANYASGDNLFKLYKNHDGLMKLSQFIMDNVFRLASDVHKRYWEKQGIDIDLTGIWFQVTNDYGFHETHVHGNCSWSGVYYVQAGDAGKGKKLANGLPNGITRFYGPHIEAMAGGHGEFGNLYLQDSKWDAHPEDGGLVIFPSHLKHMAFPYAGEKDRVIVSFHAQIRGDKESHYNYELS